MTKKDNTSKSEVKEETKKSFTLDEAILYVQKNAHKIVKDSENPHFKSKYAELPDIWKAIEGAMGEVGLRVRNRLDVCGELGDTFTTDIVHIETGQMETSTCRIILQKPNAQNLGSFVTYMRRYNLTMMLNLMIVEDDDGNMASSEDVAVPSKTFDEFQEAIRDAKNIDELKRTLEGINKHVEGMDGVKLSAAQKDILTTLKNRRKEALSE